MLRLEEFASWLRTRQPGETVGLVCDTAMCPVAGWLRDTHQADLLLVSCDRAYIGQRHEHMDAGLRHFVRKVDRSGPRGTPVTRETALAFVKELLDDKPGREMRMLNFEEFEAWLRARPDDENVGVPRSPIRCPVARWLQDIYDKTTTVGTGTAAIGNNVVLLDDKLREFIACVDSGHERYGPITKTMALSIVDSVKNEGR